MHRHGVASLDGAVQRQITITVPNLAAFRVQTGDMFDEVDRKFFGLHSTMERQVAVLVLHLAAVGVRIGNQ